MDSPVEWALSSGRSGHSEVHWTRVKTVKRDDVFWYLELERHERIEDVLFAMARASFEAAVALRKTWV